MVGIDLSFDKYKLVIREKGRITEVAEGFASQLAGFKAKEVYISFTCPKVIGKLYPNKVKSSELTKEFGVEFVSRFAELKSGKGISYFAGSVEKGTYDSVVKFIKSLRIAKIKRLNFTPLVFYDVLSFLGVPRNFRDFLALAFHDEIVFYLVCKGGQAQLVSGFEFNEWPALVSDVIKTFFEEGLNTIFISGNYPENAILELKALTEDGEVNVFNPFMEFTIGTSRDFKQASYYAALGVTL
ncbi:MAG: hypothetical protein ABIM20_03470 [candidate division WOR-3 bacterium]